MGSKNIKETIKLLDRPSDSDSSSDNLIIKPVKRNVKRRQRVRTKNNKNQCSCNRSKSRVIALWLAAVLITFWLIALSWVAAILYGEIGRMDLSIRSVAVTVPLRPPTKKMKKRKELDALAPSHVISRRVSGKRSSQELLTDSSDDRSEYWNVSVRGNRKTAARRNRSCPGLLKACSAFFGCASLLATASLIWLFIDVRQQLTSLRTEVDQAIAGSEGVPDALQKCHSLSKDLQNNQTLLFTQLTDVKAQINNFTIQLTNIQKGLHQVQELLHDAPELTNIPTQVKSISSSVATFGSKIRDLRVTVDALKETETKLQDAQHDLQQNITNIKTALDELTKVTQKLTMPTNESKVKTEELSNTISELRNNLSSINDTLTHGYQSLSDDQQKDHKLLVSLQDTTLNASMQVKSLEAECAKANEQTTIVSSVKKLTDEVNNVRSVDASLMSRIEQLEESYKNLKNSTNQMLTLNSSTDIKQPNVNATDSNNNNNNGQTIADGLLPH
ncbi:GSCOCT00002770001.2-RA-CDS [Cotesia congregata]|uniref:TNF receptor-associated factor family protein DDB_Cc n=1 Tax=Cotesia congregata TaxID=51543 RepID=A0A8J2HHE1_COTCN|nr:GSCOCT00002770001.2-RA-CDS [Cotesia congregata]CAG5097741.1 TNF receptor-associated factor family protein DDB_Cc [Cotesia congregata]